MEHQKKEDSKEELERQQLYMLEGYLEDVLDAQRWNLDQEMIEQWKTVMLGYTYQFVDFTQAEFQEIREEVAQIHPYLEAITEALFSVLNEIKMENDADLLEDGNAKFIEQHSAWQGFNDRSRHYHVDLSNHSMDDINEIFIQKKEWNDENKIFTYFPKRGVTRLTYGPL